MLSGLMMEKNLAKTMTFFTRLIRILKSMLHSYDVYDTVLMAMFFILGYFLYSFMGNSFLTNADGIVSGVVYKFNSEGIELGRLGITLVDKACGMIVSPMLSIIISLIFSGLAVLMIIDILGIKGLCGKIVTYAVLLLSPTFANTMTYFYCAVSYNLAFFLSVFSVFLYKEGLSEYGDNKEFKNIKLKYVIICLICGLLICGSLSLYQAYLAVTAALFVLIDIKVLLERGDKIVAKHCIIQLLICALGVGLYLAVTKLMPFKLASNRGFDKMGSINPVKLPNLVEDTYVNFYNYFFTDSLINNSWMCRKELNAVILFSIIVLLLYILVKLKTARRYLSIFLLIFLTAIYPVACEIITIMAPGVDNYGSTGIIIVPAMSFIYILPYYFQELIRIGVKQAIRRRACTQIIFSIPIALVFLDTFASCVCYGKHIVA